MLKLMRKYLSNRRGDVAQLIIVLIAVCAVAVFVLPKINKGISDQGDTSVKSLSSITEKIQGDNK